MFLLEKDGDSKSVSYFIACMNDECWLKKLSYLANIFSALNVLNVSLKDKDSHKLYVQNKIEVMIKKLETWARKVQDNWFDPFPILQNFLKTSEIKNKVMAKQIETHRSTIRQRTNLQATQVRKLVKYFKLN